MTQHAHYISAQSRISNQAIKKWHDSGVIMGSVHFNMASQLRKLFRSKLPSERRSSEESCDLDSSGTILSVDEQSPVETQSEALPVSLKRSKNVVDS